jgi:tetratricopeptide (TPR) repeat protein
MSEEASRNARNERGSSARADRPERATPAASSGNGGGGNAAERTEGKFPSKDITPVLRGWDYESGTINVRKIYGQDGQPKLQMRLDLGLLQMEMNGRPDGVRPHGYESLLEYFENKLSDHRRRNGTELGFQITNSDCQSLREEAVMYYHRYLSLFVLEEFTGVVRDTDRNLRVLDLCGKYAADEQDRLVLEQYRPYITMMNARARASLLMKERRYREALEAVRQGLADIKEFYVRFGQEEAYPRSNEVRVLKRFAREIKAKLPVNPVERLQRKLQRAVKNEEYEEAAKLRDKLLAMQGTVGPLGPEKVE